jgi:hypothetical protein
MEFGQSYIESLRDHHATGGLLPKVIAAYNAGPVPIAAWNSRAMDGGDPLLYIESIPYWETRGYVPIVLRNYWIYEKKAGKPSAEPPCAGARHVAALPRACRARARCGWSRSGGGPGDVSADLALSYPPYRAAMGRGTMRSMVEGPRAPVAPPPAYGWSPSQADA